MSDTFVAYCPTITGGKVLRFRPTFFPPYDKNGTQVYLVTDSAGNSIGWHVSCDGYTANVYDGPMDDEPKAGLCIKQVSGREAISTMSLNLKGLKAKLRNCCHSFQKTKANMSSVGLLA